MEKNPGPTFESTRISAERSYPRLLSDAEQILNSEALRAMLPEQRNEILEVITSFDADRFIQRFDAENRAPGGSSVAERRATIEEAMRMDIVLELREKYLARGAMSKKLLERFIGAFVPSAAVEQDN